MPLYKKLNPEKCSAQPGMRFGMNKKSGQLLAAARSKLYTRWQEAL